jgi:hypothetical protein
MILGHQTSIKNLQVTNACKPASLDQSLFLDTLFPSSFVVSFVSFPGAALTRGPEIRTPASTRRLTRFVQIWGQGRREGRGGKRKEGGKEEKVLKPQS